MSNHLSPHDRFFRNTMAKPKVAREFFENYLPIDIRSQVNLNSLELQKESFINDKLRMQITDLLYAVKFGKQEGYLYLLIEHASKPNKHMAFKLMKYKMAIMEHHLKHNNKEQLPIVYPIVLYNGKHKYNYSTDFFDLFGKQSQLAKEVFYKPYQLIDLNQIPDEELKTHLWFGVLARIMKHVYSKNILSYFKDVISDLKIIEKNYDWDYIYNIISYLFEARGKQDNEKIIEVIKTELTVEEKKIMTMADSLRKEGRIQTSQKIAEKLLCKGMDTASVSNIVELSEAKIQKIQDNLN